MRAESRTLHNGVVETRFYDDDGRLVEIRKKQPDGAAAREVSPLKRHPGVSGGHQY